MQTKMTRPGPTEIRAILSAAHPRDHAALCAGWAMNSVELHQMARSYRSRVLRVIARRAWRLLRDTIRGVSGEPLLAATRVGAQGNP